MRTEDDLVVELADELRARADELVADTFEIGGHHFPDWMREPPVDEHVFGLTRDSILAELQALRSGTGPPEALPEIDAAGARDLGRAHTPLSSLMGAYRASHQALWRAWEQAVTERALTPELADDLRRRGSDFFFAYAERVAGLAAIEYESGRNATMRSTERSFAEAIVGLLDGDESGAEQLDHPVTGHNVAVLGTGEPAKAELASMARALDARLLVLDVLPDPWWAWLGRSRPFSEQARRALRELGPLEGGQVGLGNELEGPAGFRESHRQAAAGFSASSDSRPLVHYREIAVEDLAARDLEAAEAFVATELASIDGDDQRSRRLRETLTTYFECGDNARATAAELGLHQQTVGQRLERLEERLGLRIRDRRAELEVALRLRAYLERQGQAKRDLVVDLRSALRGGE